MEYILHNQLSLPPFLNRLEYFQKSSLEHISKFAEALSLGTNCTVILHHGNILPQL